MAVVVFDDWNEAYTEFCILGRSCYSYQFDSLAQNHQVMSWQSFYYGDVIMGTMGSQITSLTIVYSTVYSGADQRKHQSSASLSFVRGIHRGQVNSPHNQPVTRKMFPFDDVIMLSMIIDKDNDSWFLKEYENAVYKWCPFFSVSMF